MPLDAKNIFTLLRELPSALTSDFHGSRSAVSSAKISQCLAPNGISLYGERFCILFRITAFVIVMNFITNPYVCQAFFKYLQPKNTECKNHTRYFKNGQSLRISASEIRWKPAFSSADSAISLSSTRRTTYACFSIRAINA